MSKFKIGDLVTANHKNGVIYGWLGKVWEVASEPWAVGDFELVKLKGERGSFRVDGLELARRCANCVYYAKIAGVCCCPDGEWDGEFKAPLNSCKKWEERIREDGTGDQLGKETGKNI